MKSIDISNTKIQMMINHELLFFFKLNKFANSGARLLINIKHLYLCLLIKICLFPDHDMQ